MRLRRIEPVLRRALRGPCAPPRRNPSARVRLVVAVSGGADSTALLLGLHRLSAELGLDLHAAHLHHGLRGAEADADLEFVRALCARLGVPLSSARWDTKARMRRRGLSGQDGLRTLRREFLAGVARKVGAAGIVTGHTADDQLETLLMRLGRGAGLVGLSGMRPRNGIWLKPLLEATRAEIEADLVRAKQSWREDRTNRSPLYARGRVRHVAVPALARALFPGLPLERGRDLLVRRAIRATSEARASAGALDRLARALLHRSCRIQRGVLTMETRRLRNLPGGLKTAALRRLWRSFRPDSSGLTDAHLASFGKLIDSARGDAIIHLPGGWTAERDGATVKVRRAGPARASGPARVSVPGSVIRDGHRIEARWMTGTRARRLLGSRAAAGEFFSAEGLDGSVSVRWAGPEESFVPYGRSRAARLGRFLSKQGVSREMRQHPIVLADARGILWVVGVRRAARAPVEAGTRKALWVRMERHD
ncbi:MAG TPA: tRNA lysidine(34) synthetase TilS [Terriglobales bacterium]|nr:tRNA lysidine(34) synthetase TilS [Terriglobales bacterium]